MSDLLICGMEMPKDRGMYIAIDIDGQSYAKPLGGLEWKKLMQKAVPVPPHGRLKDTDALIKKIPVVNYEIYENIRTLLESAPTIIQASE